MTNRWNRVIYRLWAPVYDATVNYFFLPGRKRAMEILAAQPHERILILGVGTGADLPFLPAGVQAVGIDYSPDMLAKARAKLPFLAARVLLVRGDAQLHLVEEGSMDGVLLNLILSVIPDGRACWSAALRALKPGGRIVVFDKFLGETSQLSWGRRLLNGFSTLFGTDITRRFADLTVGTKSEILRNEPSLFGGVYRVLSLQKPL